MPWCRGTDYCKCPQVTVACAVMAVQMALLCSSQAGINCAGVSQNTFTLFMTAEASDLPGVGGRCAYGPAAVALMLLSVGLLVKKASWALGLGWLCLSCWARQGAEGLCSGCVRGCLHVRDD